MIYLYSITVFGAKLTVTAQSGLLEVYLEALRAIASLVSQSPREETSPELKDGQSQHMHDVRNRVGVYVGRGGGREGVEMIYILIVSP